MILNNFHVSGNNLRKFYPLYMFRSRHLVLRTQACLLSPNRAASQACQPCSCRIRVKEPSFRQATRSFEPSHINIQSDADQVYPFSDTQQRQLKRQMVKVSYCQRERYLLNRHPICRCSSICVPGIQ